MIIQLGENAKLIYPKYFPMEEHYYSKVLHAQMHQIVKFFLNMDKNRIIERYCHLNPLVKRADLLEVLSYIPNHIQWSGTDLFHVTTEKGSKRMVVLETNSSPSGQKSMPLLLEYEEQGGYKRLLEHSFLPWVKERRTIEGHYCVMYDKNEMEASGYAVALANLINKPVFLVTFYQNDENPGVRFVNDVMEVRGEDENWHPIKAAFRYVTQKPWDRIPVKTKTLIYNPIVACLAGGRNKRMAAKAYDFYNSELYDKHLKIRTPETIKDVKFSEVPLWVERFGGQAVVKCPYANAGQGVYTITNEEELKNFVQAEHAYEDFIVQSLIGNYQWSTRNNDEKYYQVGMVPNKNMEIYVADLRFMIASSKTGYVPIALYARRAKEPLANQLIPGQNSWDMLGTNLSIKTADGWDSESDRLKLMDTKDFNQLGMGLDMLIEGYIQSVLATIAIDKMAEQLLNSKKGLRTKFFEAINGDSLLMKEIL